MTLLAPAFPLYSTICCNPNSLTLFPGPALGQEKRVTKRGLQSFALVLVRCVVFDASTQGGLSRVRKP